MIENGVVIIDRNCARRAEINRILGTGRFHVELYEGIDDYSIYPLKAATYLVHDADGVIESLIGENGIVDHGPAVVAYREAPAVAEVVVAMRFGSADYLPYPFEQGEIERVTGPMSLQATEFARVHAKARAANKMIAQLTPREAQVLDFIADGKSSKEIALELGISHRTVEIHRGNLLIKTSARNSLDLVRLYMEGSAARTGAMRTAA